MIDQRKLPGKLSYIECADHHEVADAIRTMAVRGAPAIGITAAMGLGLAAYGSKAGSREELVEDLEKAAQILRGTRPTAINLFWAIQRIMDVASASGGDADDIRLVILDEAQRMADEDIETNRRMGKLGAGLLADGDTVLTHCK